MSVIDLAEDRVLSAAKVTLRLDERPHPYERVHAEAIEENWREERTRNPALYDGRTVLFSRIGLEGEELVGRCHDVRFASLMHWRRERRTELAAHLFAMALPVTSDGAVLTVRMASWTANAGQVYFAGGSLEPPDFAGGVADVDGNMQREVTEETGLQLSGLPRERDYRFVRTGIGVVVLRRYALPWTAAEVDRRVRAFIAAETRPEIVEPVLVRPGEAPDLHVQPWVARLVDWSFARPLDV